LQQLQPESRLLLRMKVTGRPWSRLELPCSHLHVAHVSDW
jgi:hypothetical protein